MQRPSEIRQQLQNTHMPVDEVPEDEDVRQSYNFCPGYHGIVYRADTPDSGEATKDAGDQDTLPTGDVNPHEEAGEQIKHESKEQNTRYKMQAMKWGNASLRTGFQAC